MVHDSAGIQIMDNYTFCPGEITQQLASEVIDYDEVVSGSKQ